MATSTATQAEAWGDYCEGFQRAGDPWPHLPLQTEPELSWWQQLLNATSTGGDGAVSQGQPVLAALERGLPQLRLPQVVGISSSDLYKELVLRGSDANRADVADLLAVTGPRPHWQAPEALQLWIAPHPCGAMAVLQTPSWDDFEQLVRALAHRAEPVTLPNGVHAQAVSGLIHWGLIEQFGRQSRAKLIVLHAAPYGSVAAEHVPGDLNDAAWLAASTTLRLEHELTHLASKRVLGQMRLNLLDELIADCMGMVAALGWFDAALFGRCLGIDIDHGDAPIANGRWLSYTRGLAEPDAYRAVELVMARARELQAKLNQHPQLLKPEQAMVRLQWLCRQRLDQPISPAPTTPH